MSNESELAVNNQPFLKSGGIAGVSIRSMDWSVHPLGVPVDWPEPLKIAINIVLSASFPMAVNWGPDFYHFYNDAFLPLMGTDKHPGAIGRKASEVYSEIWETVAPFNDKVMNGESLKFKDMHTSLYRNGGKEECWFDFSCSPIADDKGIIKGMLIIASETTEKIINERRFEETTEQLQAINEELTASNSELEVTQENLEEILNSLQESEQRVRSIVESAPFPIGVYVGREMRISLANQSIMDVWGKGNNVVGKLYSDILPELGNQEIFAQLDAVFTTGVPFHARNQRVDLVVDGLLQSYFFNYSFTPLYDASGNIYGVMNTAADVTDLNIAKQKLEQNERNLRNMILQAPVAMCILLGPEHIITVANQLMIDIWGKEEANVINKPVYEALPDAKGQGLEEAMDSVYNRGETFKAMEQPVSLLRNGVLEEVYQNFVYEPYRDSEGNILGIIAITIDVTEQVKSRKLLEVNARQLKKFNDETIAANERYHMAIATANLGTWSVNLETDELSVSDRARKMHGLDSDESLSLTESLQLVSPEFRDKLAGIIEQCILHNTGFEMEYQIQPKDGSAAKWLRSTGKVYNNERGKGTITGTILDITERKLDELRKNDFISMVSHELKTPLTSLSAIVQLTQVKLSSNDDAFLKEAMGKAYSQIKRMTNLINGFLNISRLESGKIYLTKSRFDIVALGREIIDDLSIGSEGMRITLIQSGPIDVFADRDKIGSVIINLLSNSIKYSPGDSTIEVRFEAKDAFFEASIKDEGFGIHEKDRERIFERYYRAQHTKARMVSGFGIGLYLSAEIVNRHEGKIWVESEEGKGSTFYFRLPL